MLNQATFNVTDFTLVEESLDEAQASVGTNPTFRWCKFVLTDDLPNVNKHRIPEEEFDNLIRSGLFAPIKMAAGHIEKGHENAIPLGTITSLKRSGNKILGLAALWTEERKNDVELIKKQYDEGKPVNLSWEVFYSDHTDEENGIRALRGTTLKATTVVGLPAYQGRTPVLQVASTEDTQLELEQALAKITELEATVASAQTELTDVKSVLDQKSVELETVKTEKEELASFKAGIEVELAKAEKLQTVKSKFSEAGIVKDEQYFVDNADRLIGMNEAELDFMLQELVSFASQLKNVEATVAIPNINLTSDLSPKEIAQKLRKNR